MKFLVDNQLPPALARFLADRFDLVCHHVLDLQMERTSDRDIWQYAHEHQLILITKDEDFTYLPGPSRPVVQVIWLRLGNCHKRHLLHVMENAWPRITACLDSGERLIEVR